MPHQYRCTRLKLAGGRIELQNALHFIALCSFSGSMFFPMFNTPSASFALINDLIHEFWGYLFGGIAIGYLIGLPEQFIKTIHTLSLIFLVVVLVVTLVDPTMSPEAVNSIGYENATVGFYTFCITAMLAIWSLFHYSTASLWLEDLWERFVINS